MSTAVFSFGRFNPPTSGHLMLSKRVVDVAKKSSGKAFIFTGHTTDTKRNPLDYNKKTKYMTKAFKGVEVVKNQKIKTLFDALDYLDSQGFEEIKMVVGSDRVSGFKKLIPKYMKDYNFKKFEAVSAGERDPDSEGIKGMSASKMRAAAARNDYDAFLLGCPETLSKRDCLQMFKDVKSGMGIKEDTEITEECWFDYDEFDMFCERVMSLQTRKKMGRNAKRTAKKRMRSRKRKEKFRKSDTVLKSLSQKKAKMLLRSRLIGDKDWSSMSMAARLQVDVMLQKKSKNIDKIAKKLYPKVKKQERERLQKVKSPEVKESVQLNEPEILDRLVQQLKAKGMDNDKAHAVARSQLSKNGVLKKGSEELTDKGKKRNSMTPAERAKDRAAKKDGNSPKNYKYNKQTNTATQKEETMKEHSEEKPLLKWMEHFRKQLKKSGSSYSKVDPVDALKYYYKGVDGIKAAKELASGNKLKESYLYEDNTAAIAKQVKQAVKKYTTGKLIVRSKGGKTRFIMVSAEKIDNELRKKVLNVVAPKANVRDKSNISYGNISDRIISAGVEQWMKALGLKESVELDEAFDMKKMLNIFNKLKKNDTIKIKYDSSMRKGKDFQTFVVTSPKRTVGKKGVERVIMKHVDNPTGVKYTLYNRNGSVSLAVGDMAASMTDIKESVELDEVTVRHHNKPTWLKKAQRQKLGLGGRQLKDPKKEVMVVDKKGKVIVIDRKDLKSYERKGWDISESVEHLDEGLVLASDDLNAVKKTAQKLAKQSPDLTYYVVKHKTRFMKGMKYAYYEVYQSVDMHLIKGKATKVAGYGAKVDMRESAEVNEMQPHGMFGGQKKKSTRPSRPTRIAVDKEFTKVNRSGKMDTMAAKKHLEKKFKITDVRIEKDKNGKPHVTYFQESVEHLDEAGDPRIAKMSFKAKEILANMANSLNTTGGVYLDTNNVKFLTRKGVENTLKAATRIPKGNKSAAKDLVILKRELQESTRPEDNTNHRKNSQSSSNITDILIKKRKAAKAAAKKTESVEAEEDKKVTCPKCDGEGCEHCDDKGYHLESVELDEKIIPVHQYKEMMKWYETSTARKVFDLLDRAGWRLPAEGFTLVQNMLKINRDDVKKTADGIMKKYPQFQKESVDEVYKPTSIASSVESRKKVTKVLKKKGIGFHTSKGDIMVNPKNLIAAKSALNKEFAGDFETNSGMKLKATKKAGISDGVELDEAKKKSFKEFFEMDEVCPKKKLKNKHIENPLKGYPHNEDTFKKKAVRDVKGKYDAKSKAIQNKIDALKSAVDSKKDVVDPLKTRQAANKKKREDLDAKLKASKERMAALRAQLKESVELDEAWTADSVMKNAEIGSKKGYGITIKKTGGITKTPHKHMLMTTRPGKNVRVTFDHGKDEFEGTPQSVALYINKKLGIKESVSRDYKKEYENFHGKPEQRAKRSKRVLARREMIKAGKAKKGDGKDVDHKDGNALNNSKSNLRMMDVSKNRSRNNNKQHEEGGAGDEGTRKLVKRYKKDTPHA